jgi:hypothetical protein
MNYYLKWRTEVNGPISELVLAEQYRANKLTRFHQVSLDQVNWQPLTNLRCVSDPSYRPDEPPPVLQTSPAKRHSTARIPTTALTDDSDHTSQRRHSFRAQKNDTGESDLTADTISPYPALPPKPEPPATTSACATWSLILSILSLFMCAPLFCIPSLVLGYVGLSNIRHSKGGLIGQGLCVAGLIIAYVSIFLWLVFAIWLFALGGLALIEAGAR